MGQSYVRDNLRLALVQGTLIINPSLASTCQLDVLPNPTTIQLGGSETILFKGNPAYKHEFPWNGPKAKQQEAMKKIILFWLDNKAEYQIGH